MMDKNNPVMGVLCKVTWFLTGLCSLLVGLKAVGFDLFAVDFVRNNLAALELPLAYVFGLAGAWSLVTLVLHCTGECKS